MDYSTYVRSISFKLVQPETPRPAAFAALHKLARRAGIQLEMWMTALPEEQYEMQQRLAAACRLKRRATFAMGALINRGVAQMPRDAAFVALGVDRGFPLFAGMAGNGDRVCIGVDPFEHKPRRRERFLRQFCQWKSLRHRFFDGAPLEYLQHDHQGPIGFCTIDGRQSCHVQRDWLAALEPHLTDSACVLIDHANRPEVRRASTDFFEASPFQYQVLLDVQTPRSGHPTYWDGVMIVSRGVARVQPAAVRPPLRRAA